MKAKIGGCHMRARVIYNPVSGREQITKYLLEILTILEQAGYETSTYQTTPEHFSAAKEAKRAALAGFDLIVAAGGDGTVNEVINGIAGLEKRPILGIIPAGTTNDYARVLQIPRQDFLEAARVIAKGEAVSMDIGKANETYFMNIAAGGHLTELTYEVPTKMKALFGYLAYIIKGAEKLWQVKPIRMRIRYDGGVYEGEASMFFVLLTNTVGGVSPIDPHKIIGDGTFTLFIIKTAHIWEILQILEMVIHNGEQINHPEVIYQHTTHVEAEALDGQRLMINLDGEYGGDAPVSFNNLKRHLRVIGKPLHYVVPPETQEKLDDIVKALDDLVDSDKK